MAWTYVLVVGYRLADVAEPPPVHRTEVRQAVDDGAQDGQEPVQVSHMDLTSPYHGTGGRYTVSGTRGRLAWLSSHWRHRSYMTLPMRMPQSLQLRLMMPRVWRHIQLWARLAMLDPHAPDCDLPFGRFDVGVVMAEDDD